MIWIVQMDSVSCKIYNYIKKPADLKLLKEFVHPENKYHANDLVSDQPGHYQTGFQAHGAYSSPDPKQVKIEQFSQEIANYLEDARKQSQFDQLIIVAAPHILGLLQQHLTKYVKEMIEREIQKDFMFMKEHQLLEIVKAPI